MALSSAATQPTTSRFEQLSWSSALCGLLRGRGFAPLWSLIVGPSFPEKVVGVFVDGTIAYTLSKTWDDMLAVFVLRLHPVPYCGSSDGRMPCTANADATTQFTYALLLLLPTAFFKHSATTKGWQWIPGVDTVPSMMGMLAGWGLGNAFSELFSEIRTEYSEVVCAPPPYDGAALDCTMLDMGLASLLTLGATLIVTHVQPLTQGLQFGDGVVRARAGASLRAGAAQPPAQLSFTRLGAP